MPDVFAWMLRRFVPDVCGGLQEGDVLLLEEAVEEHRHLRARCFRHGPQGARIDSRNRRLRVVSAGGSAAGEGAGVPGGCDEESNEAVRGHCEQSTLICPLMVLMCAGVGFGLWRGG
jgi:hypothetical protein